MEKCIIYLRKSTQSEDRQALSIQGQEREVRALAQKNKVHIIGDPIRESMTAKEPGRPLFNEMIEGLKAGKANSILCWKADRLARNPVDGAALLWGLKQGYIKRIITCSRIYTNSSDDKFMLQINFGIANKFIDDLIINVKRGNKDALLAGKWPNKPKIGYIRDARTREIIPDPERYHWIRELWLRRLGGTPVLELTKLCREQWGLTTPRYGSFGNKYLSSSQLYRMFRDPFYTGNMKFNGELFKGNHKAMITWDDFQKIQNSFRAKHMIGKPETISFTYGGLLTCGRCGSLITAERKQNRHGHKYIYYHCSKKKKGSNYCPERSIQEKDIEQQLKDFIESLHVPPEICQWLFKRVRDLEMDFNDKRQDTQNRFKKQINQIDAKLKRAQDLCLEGILSTEEFVETRNKLTQNKLDLECKIENVETRVDLIEPLKRSISFVNLAKNIFENGKDFEKRELLRLLFSNLLLQDKTLLCLAKKEYDVFLKNRKIPKVYTAWPELREILLHTNFQHIPDKFCDPTMFDNTIFD